MTSGSFVQILQVLFVQKKTNLFLTGMKGIAKMTKKPKKNDINIEKR